MATPGLMAKIGAIAFVIWGILHIWVPYDGWERYLTHGGGVASAAAQWDGITGGAAVPAGAYVHTTDEKTAYAQSSLLLNFVMDVGGYGVLGLVVAYKIWTEACWHHYFMGVFLIGIADLSFLFLMVLPAGVIELKFEVILGPAIWFIAILVTPFGLPWGNRNTGNLKRD